jgi:hypothetical protein
VRSDSGVDDMLLHPIPTAQKFGPIPPGADLDFGWRL